MHCHICSHILLFIQYMHIMIHSQYCNILLKHNGIEFSITLKMQKLIQNHNKHVLRHYSLQQNSVSWHDLRIHTGSLYNGSFCIGYT